jgi:hypothetical protein
MQRDEIQACARYSEPNGRHVRRAAEGFSEEGKSSLCARIFASLELNIDLVLHFVWHRVKEAQSRMRV